MDLLLTLALLYGRWSGEGAGCTGGATADPQQPQDTCPPVYP